MHLKAIQHFGIAGLTCGIALCAGEIWNTKDASQWSDEEVTKILNDSPWAKRSKVTYDRSAMDNRGGTGPSNGGSYPSGGGYPGGGGGYPGGGGGYPGGGGGYPGGGVGGPLGGGIGFPGGGMGRRGGGPGGQRSPRGTSMPAMDVQTRWESAMPIQQALVRHPGQVQIEDSQNERAKDAAEPIEKSSYIIAVLGLHIPERLGRYDDRDDPSDNDRRPASQDTDRIRDRFLSGTRLLIKGGSSIAPSDVKVTSQYGQTDARFFFPRTRPISLDDKDVVFESRLGAMKIEQKFHVKDMIYKDKLAL